MQLAVYHHAPAARGSTPAERALALFPGGSLGESCTPRDQLVVLSHGQGDTVWDTHGRALVDFSMGWGSVLLGHAHPAVTEAVIRQAPRGANFSHVNDLAIELAEALIAGVPCAERLRFCASGTEATSQAVALARAFTGRAKILKFEGAYHGSHDIGTVGYAPRRLMDFPQAEPLSDATTAQGASDILVAPFNDAAATASILDRHRREIAAIIVEPLHRSTAAAPGFLQSLRELADDAGVLLIFDEVVTGFRLAYGGAQEYYGVKPDLAAMGKALGGGYPIGVVAGRAEIVDLFDEGRRGDPHYAYFASTFGGNPVSMAASLAVLKEIAEPDTYPRLFRLGDAVRAGLREVFGEAGVPVRTLGVGPVIGVAFADHDIRDHRGFLRSDRERRRAFMFGLFRRGIFLNPTASKLYLSCAHTQGSIDRLIDAARESLRECL
jgi:glutamate-1-semialdehyde 2,1-aminomutase